MTKSETSRFNTSDIKKNDSSVNHFYKDYSKMDPDTLTAGERMYFQYREQLPKKEALRKKQEEERMEEESKELSFHPKISKKSKELVKPSKEKIEDRLIESGMIQKQKQLPCHRQP